MKPTELLDVLHDIFEKAGLSDCVSISSEKNESAELMWFSSKEKNDYFAVNDRPLFPISCIENITYEYKKEGDDRPIVFKYDALCILRFHLKDDCLFLVEFDKDCCANLYFNSSPNDMTKWIEDGEKTEFESAVYKYNLAIEKQEFFECLINSLFDSLENLHLDIDLCKKQHLIIFDYIQTNESDNETLFLYAYEAAYYISSDYKDYPYLAAIIGEIKNRGMVDELLVYVRKRCLEYNWLDNDRDTFNSTLQIITEQIINQINVEVSDCE